MANQFNNPVVIADKMLEFFDGVSNIASKINRQYESNFAASKDSPGQTIYVEKPPRYTSQSGPVISAVNDINKGKIPVVVNKWRNVTIKLTGLEKTFNARQFDAWAEKNIKPIVSPLANDVDMDIFGLYNQIYNFVGTPTTGPTTFDVLAEARELLTLMNTPYEDRLLFLNPTGTRKLTNGLSGTYNPGSDVGQMVRTGKSFPVAGFDLFEANNVAAHTVGTAVANTSTMQTTGAGQVGSTIAMKNVTTGTTFTKGDVITIADVYSVNPTSKQSTGKLQEFVVTATTTAASNAIAALPISPSIITSGAFQTVNAAAGDSKLVTRLTGAVSTQPVQNLGFWKDAIGLVTVPIAVPDGLEGTTRSYNGMSITLTKGADIMNFEGVYRADICYGVVCFYPENCVRITN